MGWLLRPSAVHLMALAPLALFHKLISFFLTALQRADKRKRELWSLPRFAWFAACCFLSSSAAFVFFSFINSLHSNKLLSAKATALPLLLACFLGWACLSFRGAIGLRPITAKANQPPTKASHLPLRSAFNQLKFLFN